MPRGSFFVVPQCLLLLTLQLFQTKKYEDTKRDGTKENSGLLVHFPVAHSQHCARIELGVMDFRKPTSRATKTAYQNSELGEEWDLDTKTWDLSVNSGLNASPDLAFN